MALDVNLPPLNWEPHVAAALWSLYVDFLDGDQELAARLIIERMAESIPAFQMILEPGLN